MRRQAIEYGFYLANITILLVVLVISIVVLVKVCERRDLLALENASDSDTTAPIPTEAGQLRQLLSLQHQQQAQSRRHKQPPPRER
jgi:hypothetical protein